LGKILASQTLSITLVSATGHRLAEAEAAMGDFNSWQVNLDVPQSVSGPAQLQATIWDEEGTLIALDVHAVNLVLDTNTTDSYMALFRPVTGQQAVAGFNLFFDGRAQLPANNAIHISIWDENCQNQLARQTFTLRGSSYWHGFLIIPRNITGPICAVADFGEPGEEEWREAQVLIDVLPASDENAKGVIIGRPAPGDTLVAGQSVFIRGTAYNAPDNEVVVSIVLENGRILTEGIATTDLFGYWEITLFLPVDASGPAMINVSIGIAGEDDYAQSQNLVTIEPAE
jgi:hypothetical protein